MIKIGLSAGIGLAVSQLIATLYVGFSNSAFYEKLTLIRDAGYLTVPNARTMENLKTFEAAFCGGIFFTATVGACLTLTALGAAWAWDRIGTRERRVLTPLIFFWAGCLVLTNIQGVAPGPTAFFLIVPSLVFGLALGWLKPSALSSRKNSVRLLIHLACLAGLLTLAGQTWLTPAGFSRIRDRFMLDNPAGLAINNFYYRYTLYPALSYRSLYQTQMRTASLSVDDPALADRLRKRLQSYKYLIVKKDADIHIAGSNTGLAFMSGEKTVLRTSAPEFLGKPGPVLKEFSEKTDRYRFFRQVTFLSLAAVLAISGYAVLYLFFRLIFRWIPEPEPARIMSLVCCLATALALVYLPDRTPVPEPANQAAFEQTLRSGDRERRIAALKHASGEQMDRTGAGLLSEIAASSCMPERYWLARSLRNSRTPQARSILVRLMADPQLNVAYTAVSILGKQGDRQAASFVLARFRESDQWYFQMYAYNALRNLGWKNTVSE